MGSRIGGLKSAAGKLGLTLEEYQKRVASGLKRCWCCKQWKPVTEFSMDHSRSDGIAAKCYECCRENTTKPSKRERRDKLSKGLKWCCGCQKWFPTNQISNARCRLCRNAHAQERYATDAAFRKRRRQRISNGVPWQGQEILLEDSNGKCVYCGEPATTMDHIIPIIKGGKTVPGNIVPACRSCNSSKKDRDVMEWIDEKSLKPDDMLFERMVIAECGFYG